ncbi:hypothetical protein ARMGADRAFT_283342 [Armillaria gallica]|uniref:Uncharacterized protein n=1 Tax=Armillaria gallica TaxID=47427 RepID=A0A2H3D9Z7_ARMGA|nr:hypothetical protein ARMGADRAFT_283342 [Armillaria gallica]
MRGRQLQSTKKWAHNPYPPASVSFGPGFAFSPQRPIHPDIRPKRSSPARLLADPNTYSRTTFVRRRIFADRREVVIIGMVSMGLCLQSLAARPMFPYLRDV